MLTAAETLMHTTVRLESELSNGAISTGTGFFFSFLLENNQQIPVIVTNKHVIENAVSGKFILTKSDKNGNPQTGSYERLQFDNFESLWIKHPEEDVDLAVMPIANIYREAERLGISFFIPPLNDTLIPNKKILDTLTGLEDITMIGYPNGLWDEKNNMPIVRRGITATNPKNDYNGMPIVVIDCACFPGSSGSPVLVFNQGSYVDSKMSTVMGTNRIILLGILFAGPQHAAAGEIKTIQTPLSQTPIVLSQIPNNLGFIVKSQKLLDFKKLLMTNF